MSLTALREDLKHITWTEEADCVGKTEDKGVPMTETNANVLMSSCWGHRKGQGP